MSGNKAPLTVWVPPGSTTLASPGVEVHTMGQGGGGREPRRAPARETKEKKEKKEKRGAPAQDPRLISTGWKYRPGAAMPSRAQAPTVGDPESELAYVTPELLATAQEVMARYDMRVGEMTFITAKPDKGGAIWRIETNHGPRSLKQLHRPAARSLFSVGAQVYLRHQGARVPMMINSKDGVPYVEKDGKLWIVTEWVEPLYPASKVDLEGAAALCYGLGEFHRISRGYEPPHGAQKASRIYRWPKTYAKVLTKIGWFRTIADAYREMPASATLLSLVDGYERQASEAHQRLLASPYASLVQRGETAWGLAHQNDRTQSTRDRSAPSPVS